MLPGTPPLTAKANSFLTISVITVMAVIQGLQKVGGSNRIQAFRNAIAPEAILPFDQDAADLAGQIAGDLDHVGRPIGRCDPMIAAVAITHSLELVTSRWSTGGKGYAACRGSGKGYAACRGSMEFIPMPSKLDPKDFRAGRWVFGLLPVSWST